MHLTFVLLASLFIIFGNIPRIIPFEYGFGNINILELIFYVFSIYYLLINLNKKKKIKLLIIPILILITSLSIGILRTGINYTGILFCLRLILLIVASYCFSNALYSLYANNFKSVVTLFLKIYTVLAIFSIAIYFLFPESKQLWDLMNEYGIIFNGDPHEYRLISSYLDPNFYSCIIILPIILATFLKKKL